MNRLTTDEEFPHGAEGKRADKLTGHWCRGEFEATACVEKLSRYENTGLEPEEIEGMLYKWIPVEKELPQTYIFDRLWLSIQYPNGYSRTIEGRYDMYNEKFLYVNQKPIKDKVTAWMEYRTPASYLEDKSYES
ncbi:hypothetical protein [Enterocloster citroniae]|uniref:hypothetical protein n=1 Tax=Enterocloster citroniae TaxID=358743 RepID=UPI0034A35B67